MSVVKSKQRQNDLQVLNMAEDLLEFTFDICHRERTVKLNGEKTKKSVFPLKYWSCFTSKIIELASGVYDDLYIANELFLGPNTSEAEYQERRLYQNRSIAKCYAILPKITFAWHKFSINSNSIDYWTMLIYDVLEKAKAWMSSDDRRYRQYQSSKNK